MKLVVQIPAFNEAASIAEVIRTIPKKIKDVDEVIILVIDDGCTDDTVAIARKLGVTEFVTHTNNIGLARSFQDGLNHALKLGADIIVNTDGDNQYPQAKIPELIQPILDGAADIVIADRQTATISHFSPLKKLLQKVGSNVVNWAASTNLPDAPSGFRAYSRSAAFKVNVITRFSYTMETIIQAGNKNLHVTSIPVTTNPKVRESRLFKSSWEHVRKSGAAIIRAYIMYKPYAIFTGLGILFLIGGAIPFIRYLVFFLQGSHHGHLQSLILGTVLLTGAFLCFVLNIVADLLRINRILLEENLEHLKMIRFIK